MTTGPPDVVPESSVEVLLFMHTPAAVEGHTTTPYAPPSNIWIVGGGHTTLTLAPGFTNHTLRSPPPVI